MEWWEIVIVSVVGIILLGMVSIMLYNVFSIPSGRPSPGDLEDERGEEVLRRK